MKQETEADGCPQMKKLRDAGRQSCGSRKVKDDEGKMFAVLRAHQHRECQ